MVLGWMLVFDIDNKSPRMWSILLDWMLQYRGSWQSFILLLENYTRHNEHGFGEYEKSKKKKKGKTERGGDHIMYDVRCLTSTVRS